MGREGRRTEVSRDPDPLRVSAFTKGEEKEKKRKKILRHHHCGSVTVTMTMTMIRGTYGPLFFFCFPSLLPACSWLVPFCSPLCTTCT